MQFPTQKIPKKEPKLNQNWKWGSACERANRHSWSADWHMANANRHFASANWHNFEARPKNALIKLKHIYFKFLWITTQSNSYLILFSLFFKHPTSINRKKKIRNQGPSFSDFFAPLTLKTF